MESLLAARHPVRPFTRHFCVRLRPRLALVPQRTSPDLLATSPLTIASNDDCVERRVIALSQSVRKSMPEERGCPASTSSEEQEEREAMCSNNNNEAVFRGAACAAGSLCSIPEDGDLVSFVAAAATGPESRDELAAASASCRERGPVRRREAARGRRRDDDAPDEQRIFHRSPVSLDNGYKPVVLVDLRAAASPDESPSRTDGIVLEDRDTPREPRGSLSYAMTILCRVAAVLGAMIGAGAAMFVVAVVTLLLRDRLWR